MSASNGVQPGSSARILRGSGAIGGAQEAGDQPAMVSHPHGLYVGHVGHDGGRYNAGSTGQGVPARDGDLKQIEC